jgi:hypothetical protein
MPLSHSVVSSCIASYCSDFEPSTDGDSDLDAYKKAPLDADGNRVFNGMVVTRAGQSLIVECFVFLRVHSFKTDRRADKTRLYNFSKVRRSRKWLKVCRRFLLFCCNGHVDYRMCY